MNKVIARFVLQALLAAACFILVLPPGLCACRHAPEPAPVEEGHSCCSPHGGATPPAPADHPASGCCCAPPVLLENSPAAAAASAATAYTLDASVAGSEGPCPASLRFADAAPELLVFPSPPSEQNNLTLRL